MKFTEHKLHRTDNILALYEKRLAEKIAKDIENQLIVQGSNGKLDKKLVESKISWLHYSMIINFEDNSGWYLEYDGDKKSEKEIFDIINNATANAINTYLVTIEEVLCQLDACDEYAQELTILFSYHILKSDGKVEDFVKKPEETK